MAYHPSRLALMEVENDSPTTTTTATATADNNDGSNILPEDDNSTVDDDDSHSKAGKSSREISPDKCVSSVDSSLDDTDANVSTSIDEEILEDDSKEAQRLRHWTEAVPIGLGLCPWAVSSQRQRRIRYRTCTHVETVAVAATIREEARILVQENSLPLHTTLVVCPYVADWNAATHAGASPDVSCHLPNDAFPKFQEFVRNLALEFQHENMPVTLVAFHPQFLQWRDLPPDLEVGSTVQAYRMCGGVFQKSPQPWVATILETHNPVFGLRKIKVRFHHDTPNHSRREQYIPVDWLVLPHQSPLGDALPDNLMHRAPVPTIHIIQDSDLGSLRARDVSRIKRKNAQRMLTLGWEGVLRTNEEKQTANLM